jgi:hypothetical protein
MSGRDQSESLVAIIRCAQTGDRLGNCHVIYAEPVIYGVR